MGRRIPVRKDSSKLRVLEDLISPLGLSTILVTIIEYHNTRLHTVFGNSVLPTVSAGEHDNERVPRGKTGTRWRAVLLFVGTRNGSDAAVPAVPSAGDSARSDHRTTSGRYLRASPGGEAKHVSGKHSVPGPLLPPRSLSIRGSEGKE